MHTCPRREESPHRSRASEKDADTYEPDGTCSWCGSMSPDAFMAWLEAGDVTLVPTDKSYKVYVLHADPRAGQPDIFASAYFKPDGEGYVQVTEENRESLPKGHRFRIGDWVKVGPRPATTMSKFYFQHLSEVQQNRFIELLNEKRIALDYPGYFYCLPFFIAERSKEAKA